MVRLAHSASVGTKRLGSILVWRVGSDDFARWTNIRLAMVTAPPATATATSAIINRRRFQFAPNVIFQLCA